MSAAAGAEAMVRDGSSIDSALAEFEQIYRDNVGALTAYFARRCADPQSVADLVSETIVRAATGFSTFDPGRGRACAWLFGIAGHVYAHYCAQASNGRDATARLAGLAFLTVDEIEELTHRIEAERTGKEWLERCAELSEIERAAIELVDLDGLTPKEAAEALGVPRGVLRKRLSRARARLRKERLGNE